MSHSTPNTFLEQPAKRCSRGEKCIHPDGPWLPAIPGYFVGHQSRKDGLYPQCNLCKLAAKRRWKNKPGVREAQNKRQRERLRESPELRKRAVEYVLRYHQTPKGRENHRKIDKSYRIRRRETPEGREAIRIQSQCRNQRRRARVIGAEGTHTVTDIALQLKAQTDKKGIARCWWCNKPLGDDKSVDHRIPLVKGGTNWPNNICIAHLNCNKGKGARMPWEFNGRLL